MYRNGYISAYIFAYMTTTPSLPPPHKLNTHTGLPVCSHAATAGTENAIRRQYPDMINQHRQWPHGYR